MSAGSKDQPLSLPAVLRAETSAAQDENHQPQEQCQIAYKMIALNGCPGHRWSPLLVMVGPAVPPAIDWTLRAQRLSVKNLL
jgi:hypothetical protein